MESELAPFAGSTCEMLKQLEDQPEVLMRDKKAKKSSLAFVELLDRESPEAYQQEWLERIRGKPDETVKATTPALAFRIAGEWLAIALPVVAEVMPDASVHRVPHRTNEVLRGIVNVRGELQLAISLRTLLGLETRPTGQSPVGHVYPRMIMLLREGQYFVSSVDEVLGVIHFQSDTMETLPITVSKALATYSKGLFPWLDRKIAMIDDELLFHSILKKYL